MVSSMAWNKDNDTLVLLNMCKIESVRSSVNKQLTLLGEEIVCVLDTTTRSDLLQLKLAELSVFVRERLSAAAELICDLYQREIVDHLQTQLERQHKLLDHVLNPRVTLHREDVPLLLVCKDEISSQQLDEPEPPYFTEERHQDLLHTSVCKESSSGQQEGSPGVVQDEPDTPQIKEEREELRQWPEEADWSTTTAGEHGEITVTVPPANSQTENMNTQADAEDCEASQLTSDEDTDDSDDWAETGKALSIRKTLRSCKSKTQHANKPFQDAKLSKQTPSMRTHLGKKSLYDCTVCDQSYVSNLKLKRHMRTHPEKLCKVCGKGFKHNYLKKHMRIHTEPVVDCICKVCGKCFKRKSRLLKHMKFHPGGKPLSCTVCYKSFVSNWDFKRHMSIHAGERPRPFSCEVCGNCYLLKGDLNRHMGIHTGERPFSCEICGKSYFRNGHLQNHMRIHTGDNDKTSSCIFCGKNFTWDSQLKLHIRTHTGEKPFLCTVCGKSFSESGHVKRHMVTHTGEKPFSCTVCTASFSLNSILKQHMATHTGKKPFSCTICGNSFAQSGNLKQHMRTHTEEKPFSCTLCGDSFSQSGQVKQHMRTHTGEKPFSCEVCGNSFSQSGHLKQHMKTHKRGKKPLAVHSKLEQAVV